MQGCLHRLCCSLGIAGACHKRGLPRCPGWPTRLPYPITTLQPSLIFVAAPILIVCDRCDRFHCSNRRQRDLEYRLDDVSSFVPYVASKQESLNPDFGLVGRRPTHIWSVQGPAMLNASKSMKIVDAGPTLLRRLPSFAPWSDIIGAGPLCQTQAVTRDLVGDRLEIEPLV